MKMRILTWALLIIPVFLSVNLAAASLYLDSEDSYDLAPYSDYLEDPRGTLTLEEVKERDFSHKEVTDYNFGFTESVYWFKVTIVPSAYSSYQEWWLRIYYPLLDEIKVYGVDEVGELLFVKRSGDLDPYAEREVKHSSFLFFVPFDSREVTLYVRVKTESSMQVPMVLQHSVSVIEEDQLSALLMGLYYGIFIIIVLYNLVMYSYTKERTYIYYLVFIVIFVLWQLTLNGVGIQFLWSDWPWMTEHGAPLTTALAGTASILFSRTFLQTPTYLPRLDRVLVFFMYLSAVVATVGIFLTYRTAIVMSAALATVIPILLLFSGILVWRHYFRPARFYVLGWSSFLLGTVVIALNKYGLFTGYFFFNHAQQLGSALEMIFLSWALADRIKLMQDEYVGKLSSLNVTLQKKVAAGLEKEREKDRMLLKQSRLAAMGEMIEQIAHQWRQPLNTMALIMQDLYFKFKLKTFVEEDFDKANTLINENLQYMSKTIDDFRNFHQPGVRGELTSIEAIVNMAITLNEASLKYSNITCTLHSNEPHNVVVARNELVQILMNLIKNSRDAMTERRVGAGRIDIYVETGENMVTIVVEDNAGGIPEVVMDQIFEPYFTTKSKSKGTGLGLYMSRSIIEESMGGTLQAQNGEHGARFIITLPKKSPSKAPKAHN
jgi:signal transduction histidine kinase